MINHRVLVCAMAVLLAGAGATPAGAADLPPHADSVGEPGSGISHQFQFNLGYTRVMMLDHLASPNVFDSNGGTVRAGYGRNSPSWLLSVQTMAFFDVMYPHGLGRVPLAFRFVAPDGEVLEDYGALDYWLTGGGLTIEALFPVFRGGPASNDRPFSFSTGAGVDERMRYSLAQQWQGMINTASLNAVMHAEYRPAENHHLSASVSFPLVSLVTRMPWSLDPVRPGRADWISFFKVGTRFATVDTFQHVQATVTYRYTIASGATLVAAYQPAWLHYSLPRDITVVSNHIALGVEL